MYDLDTGEYKGSLHMLSAPKWLQGVVCYDGSLYVTCDDGDAEENAPDSMYRVDPKSGEVTLERRFDDVTRQRERRAVL